MIRAYVTLTKPGIVLGNALTAAGGFALASKGHIQFGLFLATLVGLSCIVASSCICNNYFDRKTDAKMIRTQNRPLVTGLISVQSALVLALLLGLLGTLLLSLYTNPLTLWTALAGAFVYLGLYGFWKYRSTWGTIIGSLAGAVPPVVGYCAVSNRLDVAAWLLFALIALWQMPHFYAIAVYRFNDYVAASIPVLPVIKGMRVTKVHMLLYIIAFTLTALLLTLLGYTGYVYLAVIALLGLSWAVLCVTGFKKDQDTLWGRRMFQFSLVVVLIFSSLLWFL